MERLLISVDPAVGSATHANPCIMAAMHDGRVLGTRVIRCAEAKEADAAIVQFIRDVMEENHLQGAMIVLAVEPAGLQRGHIHSLVMNHFDLVTIA